MQKKVVQAGKVVLVGAGPGDPELLTVKALRAIQAADLILFDHLVSDAIRALFPATVPAFYVGKKKGAHSIAQRDLHTLMIKHARQGKVVCRLKGGDPFVFGRGGEEVLALNAAGIAAEVVPGITAASGCATYAGIPLTHRGLAQGCTFVTAQGESQLNTDWQALAKLEHTIVFYMGVSKAPIIAARLLAAGLSAQTPVGVIENGCRATQRTLTGTLAGLAELVQQHDVKSPALIVVGKVVALAGAIAPSTNLSQWSADAMRLSA